jgi:sigma-E factor negative regulatory protein RseB
VKLRNGVLVGATVGVILLAGALIAVGAEGDEDGREWDRMVDDARKSMDTRPFEGTIEITWRDSGDHEQTAEIDVRHAHGVLEVEAERTLIATDGERVLGTGNAWNTLARDTAGANLEMAKGKYDVTHDAGPEIAGRSTTVYEAGHDGTTVERVYVDDGSGIALRRETLDQSGDVVRSVSFTDIELGAPASTPSTVRASDGPAAIDHLDPPYRGPDEVGDGFRLAGEWERPGDVVQLYYSDGLLSVSVFEQKGRLDGAELPAGGTTIDFDGRDGHLYETPVGEVLVFERNGVVYTCIGDAPIDEITGIALDVSAPTQSRWERMADLVVTPFGW